MTEPKAPMATLQSGDDRDNSEGTGLARLNARTAKRQQLLLAGIAAVLLAGTSWVILGPEAKT